MINNCDDVVNAYTDDDNNVTVVTDDEDDDDNILSMISLILYLLILLNPNVLHHFNSRHFEFQIYAWFHFSKIRNISLHP